MSKPESELGLGPQEEVKGTVFVVTQESSLDRAEDRGFHIPNEVLKDAATFEELKQQGKIREIGK